MISRVSEKSLRPGEKERKERGAQTLAEGRSIDAIGDWFIFFNQCGYFCDYE